MGLSNFGDQSQLVIPMAIHLCKISSFPFLPIWQHLEIIATEVKESSFSQSRMLVHKLAT